VVSGATLAGLHQVSLAAVAAFATAFASSAGLWWLYFDRSAQAGARVDRELSRSWLILGGTGLFIAGHAAFKAILWHRVPRERITALAVLGCSGCWCRTYPRWR
jgi:hypothetical protein